MVRKTASVSVSRGDASELHDRRAYTPPNAEASFADANVMIFDVGDYRAAVNDEMRPVIADYNARRAAAGERKRAEVEAFNANAARLNEEHANDEGWVSIKAKRFKPEKYRGKGFDYFSEVKGSEYKNDQQPVIEYVLCFGRRETHGVCDDPFNDEEYDEAKRLDAEDGGDRAKEYEATHFDYDRWQELKLSDPEKATAYAQEHRARGDKATRHDEAREMALELGRKIASHSERFLPKGAKLLMVVLHDDEPGGTPHLHIAFAPFAKGYRSGLEKRISLSKCFHDAGYEGSEYMKVWQDEIKAEMGSIMRDRGYEREIMGNNERHLPPAERRSRERAERAHRRAEQVEAKLLEKRRELYDAEAEAEAVGRDLERARQRVSKAERDRSEAEDEERRARARTEVLEHGYAPPWYARALVKGTDFTETAEMSEIARWLDEYGADEDGYELPADLERAAAEGDDIALADRYLDLVAEQVGDSRGAHALMYAGYGAETVLWWVAPDAEPVDGVFADAASELAELTDVAIDAGIDPTKPYAGIAEREADLAARELDSEQREASLVTAAEELLRAREELSDVPSIEGRDADTFADDVVMTFAHELAASGIPAYVTCADTMRRQWQHGHQQRVLDDGGFVSDRTLREIVLDTVRRGGEVMQRIRDGLKAKIDRALEILGRSESAEQKVRRTQRATVQGTSPTCGDLTSGRLDELEQPQGRSVPQEKDLQCLDDREGMSL